MSEFNKWRFSVPEEEVKQVADICFGGHGEMEMKRFTSYSRNARAANGEKPCIISIEGTERMRDAIWVVSGVWVPWEEIIGDRGRETVETCERLRESKSMIKRRSEDFDVDDDYTLDSRWGFVGLLVLALFYLSVLYALVKMFG